MKTEKQFRPALTKDELLTIVEALKERAEDLEKIISETANPQIKKHYTKLSNETLRIYSKFLKLSL